MNRDNISKIWLSEDAVWIQLIDGRTACEKFEDYSHLSTATSQQRQNYRIGQWGIHWQEIDEDLSFDGFFAGK